MLLLTSLLSTSWLILGVFLLFGMAIIKFGHIIAEARGKLGGIVFARNSYGAYMRAKITPKNPSTTFQVNVRAMLTAAAKRWSVITDAQRLSWKNLADELSRTNIFGDNVPLTAFNCFVRLNVNRQLMSQALLDVAPLPISGTPFTALSIATLSSTVMTVAFAPTPTAALNHLVLYATKSLGKGISFVQSDYRLVKVYAPATASLVTVFNDYVTRLGTPITGKKVFIKAFILHQTSGIPTGSLTAVKDVS